MIISPFSISFLLGAGFSAPAGYPVGSVLNDQLFHGDKLPCEFHTDVRFVTGIDGKKPNLFPKSMWQECWEFGLRLMKYYIKNIANEFDYERFFDYIQTLYQKCDKTYVVSDELKAMLPPCYVTEKRLALRLYIVLDHLLTVLPKVVSYLLIEPKNLNLNTYNLLFDQIKKAINEDVNISIHSLNHDELIEKLVLKHHLNNYFSDGFEADASNYYVLTHYKTEKLAVFSNEYKTPLRLFKLHGGTQYYPFFEEKESGKFGYADYVKGIPNMDEMNLFSVKNGIRYRGTFLPNPDFLIGEKSKQERYGSIYYQKQLHNFRENVKCSKKLIIIGYAFKDSGINKIIQESLQPNSECIVIDSFWNAEKDSILHAISNKSRVIESSVDSLDINWRTLMFN